MSFDLPFRKKVIILSSILGVLVMTYVLGMVFSPESVRLRASREPLTPILQKESIREIRLAGSEEEVQLKKEGENWTVLISGISFPAAETRIDSFLDAVAALKKSRIVATGEDTWSSFEVDAGSSRRIQLKDGAGKMALDLHVGKMGPGTDGNYVRLEGSSEVVQVDRSLEYYAGSGSDLWSDLRFFPRDLQGQDLIRIGIRSRIRFDAEGRESARPIEATLFLDNGAEGPVWKLEGQEETMPSSNVERLANTLASFEGSRFVADLAADQAGFDQPLAEIVLTTNKDVEYRLLVGNAHPQEQEQYYVRLDGQTYSYLVPAWRIRQVLRGPEELREGNAP